MGGLGQERKLAPELLTWHDPTSNDVFCIGNSRERHVPPRAPPSSTCWSWEQSQQDSGAYLQYLNFGAKSQN